jgi:hypothetical protein
MKNFSIFRHELCRLHLNSVLGYYSSEAQNTQPFKATVQQYEYAS